MCVLLRTFLLLKRAEVVPAQRDADIAAILDREFSWVVTDPAGQTHIKWQAMTAVFAHSPLFSGWRDRLVDEGPGTDLYEWVADNRGAFGRWFARWLPWEGPRLPERSLKVLR